MPRASTTESFLWRAAPRPGRARLIGAIAIALSCGLLGVLLGRWSTGHAPPAPGTRTEALIEAVARETQAKSAPAAKAPPIEAAAPKGSAEPGVPVASSPANALPRGNRAVSPEPTAAPADANAGPSGSEA